MQFVAAAGAPKVATAQSAQHLEKLSSGPVAVGILADQLPVSRPVVSQHLRVLKGAELVVESAAGIPRLYRINKPGLQVVHEYANI